jgi:uncharacterized protein YxjI
MKKVKNLKVYAAGILLLATLTATTGCTKTMDCDIEIEHAHKYETAYGIETYRISEKEHLGDLYWSENNTPITDEINIMTKYNLVRIDENINAIDSLVTEQDTYQEYEYRYTTYIRIGKVTVPQTRQRWTIDEDHSRLTGNIRDVSYEYCSYRTFIDKDGKVQLEKSEYTNDIYENASEYPYMKLDDYYKLAYSNKYTKEAVLKK